MATDTMGAKLAYLGGLAQADWGDPPAGTGWKYLRLNSDSLEQADGTIMSDEITGNRNPRGEIVVSSKAQGAIPVEFSADTLDDMISHAFMESWSTPLAVVNGDVTISAADAAKGTCTMVSGDHSFVNVVADSWIKFSGFNTSANNGWAYVSSRTDQDNITCSGRAFVNTTGAEEDIGITGSYIRIGTEKQFMALERQWDTDGDGTVDTFDLFTWMLCGGMDLNVAVGQLVKGSVKFLGKDQNTSGSSAAGTPDPVNDNLLCTAIDGIQGVYIGETGGTTHFGLPLTTDYVAASHLALTEVNWTLDNGLAEQMAIGSFNPIGVRAGVAKLTGTLKMYMDSATSRAALELINYQSDSLSSLAYQISDGTTTYVVSIRQILYTAASNPLTGASADGYINMSWSAQRNAISSTAITICKG
jgi:hypothetical protein